eukprot:COSAG06_NODE_14587_length_1145_cov_1.269598_1_plen_255_part_10
MLIDGGQTAEIEGLSELQQARQAQQAQQAQQTKQQDARQTSPPAPPSPSPAEDGDQSGQHVQQPPPKPSPPAPPSPSPPEDGDQSGQHVQQPPPKPSLDQVVRGIKETDHKAQFKKEVAYTIFRAYADGDLDLQRADEVLCEDKKGAEFVTWSNAPTETSVGSIKVNHALMGFKPSQQRPSGRLLITLNLRNHQELLSTVLYAGKKSSVPQWDELKKTLNHGYKIPGVTKLKAGEAEEWTPICERASGQTEKHWA